MDAGRRDLAVRAGGFLLAVVVPLAAFRAGLAGPYALVVGVAVGLSAGNVRGPYGLIFDDDRYVRERGAAGRALDAALSAVGSGLLGGAAVWLVGPDAGVLAYALGAAAAALGNNAVFLAMTRTYVNPARPRGR